MEWIIERGRTKEQALEKALKKLGARPEEVKVELLEKNKGFLSFLGDRSVKVKVSYINQENEIEETEEMSNELKEAKQVLLAIVEKMGIPCTVDGENGPEGLYLTIRSDKGGLIIGKRGETLDALQYIVTKIIQKRAKRKMTILVDTEDYRKRGEEKLTDLARTMAARVKQTGQSVTLRNLTTRERKLIHTLFKEEPEIETISQGDGITKTLVITLRGKSKNEWIN